LPALLQGEANHVTVGVIASAAPDGAIVAVSDGGSVTMDFALQKYVPLAGTVIRPSGYRTARIEPGSDVMWRVPDAIDLSVACTVPGTYGTAYASLHWRAALRPGHKVLVFSQFTSFLSIVRRRLDERAITYEYLDGKTTDRQARVQRFQEDTECRLFLVSLKAGGQGLNLTAADYIYILDPWWNPAVEAQAVDRAHRIGQTRRVFAYRLIARDTVEEKIVALQDRKRELAESIVRADDTLVSSLTAEDVEMLLS
jgi:SNF2 family DNA or RNA helicase